MFIVYCFSCNVPVLDASAIRGIVKRVVVSNCVKRAFVNACDRSGAIFWAGTLHIA